jgi:hypothetical protein
MVRRALAVRNSGSLSSVDETIRDIVDRIDLLDAEHYFSQQRVSVRRPTRLVCPVAGVTMDGTEQRAVMLPNGTVLSEAAVASAVRRDNTGGDGTMYVHCPRTGQRFPVSDVKKTFIL